MTHPHPGAIALTTAAARRVTEHFAGHLSEARAAFFTARNEREAGGWAVTRINVSHEDDGVVMIEATFARDDDE